MALVVAGVAAHRAGRRLAAPRPARRTSATATTVSTEKPSQDRRSPGAEAPKRSMETERSTHVAQPMQIAASTESFGTPDGRTTCR